MRGETDSVSLRDRRRLFTTAALLGAALAVRAPPARAVDKLQVVGQGSLGWTDNVHSVPDEPVADLPPKSADVFAILSPSLILARLTPSDNQRLSYTFAANLFLDQYEATSFSNRLEWLGHFTTSERTELLLGAGITQDQPYTSPTLADAATQTLRATLPTTDSYVLVRADEVFTVEPGRFWRLWQGAAAGLQTPVDPDLVGDLPTTYELGGRLGAERTIGHDDAVGVEVRSRYTLINDAVGEGGVVLGDLAQVINEYVGIWRHDWSRYVSSRLEAGAVHVIPIARDGELLQPAGAASLGYFRDEGRVELGYTHTVRTNMILGQLILVDEVALRGTIPVDEDDKVWLSSSVGYQKGRLIGPDGELETEVDVILGDVGAVWSITDHVGVGLRYQHINQRSDTDVPPLPLSYDRNTVMGTVTLRWPPDDEMPRRYREPSRVDQRDELLADEPDQAPIPGRSAR